jgi:hypothetical protein
MHIKDLPIEQSSLASVRGGYWPSGDDKAQETGPIQGDGSNYLDTIPRTFNPWTQTIDPADTLLGEVVSSISLL